VSTVGGQSPGTEAFEGTERQQGRADPPP
jgi:hypothetical protein